MNYYAWRNKYFYSTGYHGYLYRPYGGAKEAIMKQISKQAFFVKKSECLDLPESTTEIRYIEMDDLQKQKYNAMLKENIFEFQDHITLASNELSKILKLRELTSGFVYSTEHVAVHISDTKLNELKNILEEINPENQVIVWCNFKEEIKMIQTMLKDGCAVLHGGLNQKEKDLNIKVFKEGKIPILLSHPASGGFGLNLANASYCIWFSLSYSNELWSQANERIRRPDQTQKCTYVYLLARMDGKKTVDEIIYKVLTKKRSLSDECLAMLKGG